MKYEVIGQNHVAVPTHFFKVNLSTDGFVKLVIGLNMSVDNQE